MPSPYSSRQYTVTVTVRVLPGLKRDVALTCAVQPVWVGPSSCTCMRVMSAGLDGIARTPPPITCSLGSQSAVTTIGMFTSGRGTLIPSLRAVTLPMDGPGDPGTPAGPLAPVGPTAPGRPGGPAAPAGPAAPTAPGAPGAPVGPGGPGSLQTFRQSAFSDGTVAKGACVLASARPKKSASIRTSLRVRTSG